MIKNASRSMTLDDDDWPLLATFINGVMGGLMKPSITPCQNLLGGLVLRASVSKDTCLMSGTESCAKVASIEGPRRGITASLDPRQAESNRVSNKPMVRRCKQSQKISHGKPMQARTEDNLHKPSIEESLDNDDKISSWKT